MIEDSPADIPPPVKRRRSLVGRPIRRALLLFGWAAVTLVLAAEIFVSVQSLIG